MEIRKLHDLIYVHVNNYGLISNSGIPEVLEISFVRKNLNEAKGVTIHEPNDNWNFLYPVIQASKEGKDLMILVYYVVNTIKDLRTFSKLIIVGAITPEIIKTCDIIKAGEKTKFGTISQIDNYITKLNKNYKPIESFINI